LIYLRARYYAPGDGRFISRDSWDGDYNRPLSLNRWNYVEGNPVNFVDPLGNKTLRCDSVNDLDCTPPPTTTGYSEKIPPAGVNWFPVNDPLYHGAIGIPQNTNAAQFVDAEYNHCTDIDICVHYGLCGQGALSAITGLSVEYISKAYIEAVRNEVMFTGDSPPDYTGPGTLVEIVNKVIKGGWNARGYTWYDFGGGSNIANQIHTSLSRNEYIIAGVKIMSGSSYPSAAAIAGKVGGNAVTHWVVITGMSQEWKQGSKGYISESPFSPWNWVRILNPFDNQTEYYHWGDFYDAWYRAGKMTVAVGRN